jgi:hypothetical protein
VQHGTANGSKERHKAKPEIPSILVHEVDHHSISDPVQEVGGTTGYKHVEKILAPTRNDSGVIWTRFL